MNCEICGNRIVGKPTQITIERSLLTVCQECSRFGTPVDRKTAVSIERSSPKPGPKKIMVKTPRREGFDDFVLVDNFGERIRKSREAHGITRDAFAKSLGEKESVIRRIEANEMYPTLALTKKMERLLKINLIEKIDTSIKGSLPSPSSITLGDIAVLKEGKGD